MDGFVDSEGDVEDDDDLDEDGKPIVFEMIKSMLSRKKSV
jgi:hypothetical protein